MLEILINRDTEHEIRKRLNYRLTLDNYDEKYNYQSESRINKVDRKNKIELKVKSDRKIHDNFNLEKYRNYQFRKPFILYSEFNNISNEEDGNPIYYCEIPALNRQIRVIHEDKSNSRNIQIGVWINESDFEYYKYDELVISLEPTDESLLVAEEISYCWLCNSLSISQIESIITRAIKVNLTKT